MLHQAAKPEVVCISVIRDPSMYTRCLANNPHVNGYRLHAIDNQADNTYISIQYNRFLDAYDFAKPAWLIFCHEDFEIQEDLSPYFEIADQSCLYGPIGTWTKIYFGCFYLWKLAGVVNESRRDGTAPQRFGTFVKMGTPVETFDCQCLIVHSDLISRTGLRFDPQLSYDLYVEDFCIQANENHKIISRIMPFSCKHWSSSVAAERYYPQEQYLKDKYPNCCYTGTSSYDIGTPNKLRRCNAVVKRGIKKLLALTRSCAKSS